MRKMDNWIIIELTDFVLSGTESNKNIYSDKLMFIQNGYAFTERDTFKLGEPDKVWVTTSKAQQYMRMFKKLW